MIFINRQVNNHYSMVGTHFLQTGYLLLNRNAPSVLLSVAHNSYAFLLLSHTYFMCFFYIHFLLLIFRYMLSAVLSYFMPTIKRPDHRAFYSYHKLAGTTFPIYLLPFLPQPYSYRISCSMTMPDWNCISSFSLDSTLMVEISRLTRSLSNSGIWQVLVLK